MSTYSQPSFSSSAWKRGVVWTCKLGLIFQERLKIEVKLLFSAHTKSYSRIDWHKNRWPWVTLNGYFTSFAPRVITAVGELLVDCVYHSSEMTYNALRWRQILACLSVCLSVCQSLTFSCHDERLSRSLADVGVVCKVQNVHEKTAVLSILTM